MHMWQNRYKPVTDGTMKKFGLIGHPISHSLSPALFNAAFGGKYTYDLIEEADFEKAYDRFLDEYDAVNVTAPFKEKAFAAAGVSTGECRAVGAANILMKGADGVSAANSDIMGVTGALEACGVSRDSRGTALVVGCGGAAMAAVYAMALVMGHETYVINRNMEKATDFAARMKTETGACVHVAPLGEFRRLFREADVIIYTLPVALAEISSLTSRDLRGGSFLRKKTKVVLEANYKDPAFTPDLMEKMRRANPSLSFVSGKEWLLYQAVGAYGYFVDDRPDIERMREILY